MGNKSLMTIVEKLEFEFVFFMGQNALLSRKIVPLINKMRDRMDRH